MSFIKNINHLECFLNYYNIWYQKNCDTYQLLKLNGFFLDLSPVEKIKLTIEVDCALEIYGQIGSRYSGYYVHNYFRYYINKVTRKINVIDDFGKVVHSLDLSKFLLTKTTLPLQLKLYKELIDLKVMKPNDMLHPGNSKNYM